MADLLRKPSGTTGKVHDITPESAGWGYVGFGLYRLEPGDRVAEATGGREVILVLVEGKTEVIVLQSTVSVPASQKTREACLSIIKSFKREEVK